MSADASTLSSGRLAIKLLVSEQGADVTARASHASAGSRDDWQVPKDVLES
jgi:hypothetical protein